MTQQGINNVPPNANPEERPPIPPCRKSDQVVIGGQRILAFGLARLCDSAGGKIRVLSRVKNVPEKVKSKDRRRRGRT